jgi:hypothetical protein
VAVLSWSHRLRALAHVCPALVLASCAALGGDNGGGENLPNRGVVPYDRVVTEASDYILVPEGTVRYRDPSVVVVDDAVRLYLTVSDGDETFVAVSMGDAGGQAFAAPIRVSDGASPSVMVAADGTYLMAYATSVNRIDIASSGDGITFDQVGGYDAPAGTTVSGPSLLQTANGSFELFYTADGVAIARATAGANLDFAFDAIVFEPGTDCLDIEGAPEACWDADSATDAEVRLSRTGAGRTLYRMLYSGSKGSNTDLGFAASEDGLTWSRYRFNPVVDDDLKQLGPTNTRQADRYLLYWSESAPSGHGIAMAINDTPAPSETF